MLAPNKEINMSNRIDTQELTLLMQEFISTRSTHDEESYCSDRDHAEKILGQFMDFAFNLKLNGEPFGASRLWRWPS